MGTEQGTGISVLSKFGSVLGFFGSVLSKICPGLATLASLTGEPLLPMMADVSASVSTSPARAPTKLGGNNSDRGSRMSSVGVDSFAGLDPFAILKAHEI